MNIRRKIKNLTCTPMQVIKQKVCMYFGQGFLYGILCALERLIVGSRWIGIAEIVTRDKFGGIIGMEYAYNAQGLVNGGEQAMLDLFLAGLNAPAGFELACFDDTVAETDTPSDLLGEPSTNGYARVALARNGTDWPTRALDSGDWKVTAKVVTFSATGGSWGPVNTICLITTDGTPRLIAYFDISAKTPADAQSFDVTYSVKLS